MIELRKCLKGLAMVLSVLLMASCGVQRAARIDELSIVNAHYSQRDIIGLISDLSLYPAYSDEAEEALFKKIDYSIYNYADICRFAFAAREDISAAPFFDSLKVEMESRALDVISKSDIEGAGLYYVANPPLRKFLRPYIEESYLSNIDGLDYTTLKSLYKSFSVTDISESISPRYHFLRDSLLADISSALDSYFQSEEETLDEMEYAIRHSADEYVKSGTETIISRLLEKNTRNLFKRVFKREEQDRYSFEEYAGRLVYETFQPSYVTGQVETGFEDFVSSSNEYRMKICEKYLKRPDPSLFINNSFSDYQLYWVIGNEHARKLDEIKFTANALTIGSFALGFVPGVGAIALAADVADFAYGMNQDKKEDEAMKKFTATLYGDSLDCIESYLQDVFGDIRSQRAESEKCIRRRLNEDF